MTLLLGQQDTGTVAPSAMEMSHVITNSEAAWRVPEGQALSAHVTGALDFYGNSDNDSNYRVGWLLVTERG